MLIVYMVAYAFVNKKKIGADRMAGEGRREARSALLRGMGLLHVRFIICHSTILTP